MEINPELKKQLSKAKGETKELPPISLGNENTETPAPTIEAPPDLEAVVEQNPQIIAETIGEPPTADPAALLAKVEKYKGIIDKQNAQIKELKESASVRSLSDASRKFRIYLSLIEGFTAKGDFSQDSLFTGGQNQRLQPQQAQAVLTSRIQHVANLVEHFHQIIDKLPKHHQF